MKEDIEEAFKYAESFIRENHPVTPNFDADNLDSSGKYYMPSFLLSKIYVGVNLRSPKKISLLTVKKIIVKLIVEAEAKQPKSLRSKEEPVLIIYDGPSYFRPK